MLHKIKGVVFRFTKYGETSIIVTVFTDQLGLQSYLVNGVRSKSSKSKIALFQPLTILEMVVYYREHANINRIKEVRCLYPYQNLYHDMIKSSVGMFVNEVINKAIKEESHTQNLCEFLVSSLITLDNLTETVENFHLIFLIKLSRFLGFGAHNVNEILVGKVTDHLIEGLLEKLLKSDYTMKVPMSNIQRREILDLLISYYHDHAGMSGELKSMQVLREILR